MNNKVLLIIFAALLGIYLFSKVGSGKKQRSFNPDIVQMDTAQVHRIIFHPRADEGKPVTLERSDKGTWMISKDQRRVKALTNPVRGMLGSLSLVKASRIVAKSQERWSEYELGEEKGNKVKVLDATGNVLADFIVGRFNFNQQTRSGTSYIRLNDDADIYAIDGFLNMSFGQGFDSYRNSQVLQAEKENLTAISITTEGGAFNASKNANNQWATTDGVAIDSTAMDNYLNQFLNVSGRGFADEANVSQLGAPIRSLSISGNNMIGGGVKVECYQGQGLAQPFVIRSSMNEALFSSDSTGLYSSLFVLPEG